MNKNKRGLSTIVATLLIILLTLVAVGIIWVVVRNVITGGSQQVSTGAMCLQANVAATSEVHYANATHTVYNITLTRQGGTNDVLGGVKLVFGDAGDTASSVVDIPEPTFESLSTKTENFVAVPLSILATPTKVNVFVYFLDDTGAKQLCTNSNEFIF
jgi:hypothetical protein